MAAPGHHEAGETLIEVLMAVAIMGVAVTAVLGGMGTGLVASNLHRSQANAGVTVMSAVEKVKSPATAYQPCAVATNAVYLAAARSTAMPTGWVANSTVDIPAGGIRFWDGAAFGPVCHDNLALPSPFLRMQHITVKVVSPDGKAVESLSFVKRG